MNARFRCTDPIELASPDVQRQWQIAQAALADGLLEESLEHIDAALDRCGEDADLRARLCCGRAAIRIELGLEVDADELRDLLMKSAEPVNQHLAAYQLARMLDLTNRPRKGLFYAQLAKDQGGVVGVPTWLAYAHNLTGNLLMRLSRFEEARFEYRRAVELHAHADLVWMSHLSSNLGYCEVVLGETRRGLELLYGALRRVRRHAAARYELCPELDLAFALLCVDREDLALKHARRGLVLAEDFEEEQHIDNALFLVAESAKRMGRVLEARRSVERLAERRGQPEAADMLMMLDTLPLVNLKA